MKVALVCCGRLENRYAVEFVDYYKKLNFDHIYIIDNNHDSEEYFEDVLQSYIDKQFVTIYNYRNYENVQCFAYEEVYKLIKNDYDWVFFCDFDEYLTFEKNKTIQDYLSRQCFKNYNRNQILIKWRIYSDNDLIYDDGRSCLERFTKLSITDNWTKDLVKPIVRTIIDHIYIDETVHFFHTKNNILENTSCDCNGNIVKLDPSGVPKGICIDNELAYIKHFTTKTIDEFINNKLRRGTGDISYEQFLKNDNLEKFFTYNNITNEKLDYLEKRGFDISKYN